MESTTHRHTVSVAELRRVLANAPTSGAQRPSLTTAFPSHNRRRSTTLSTANGRVPPSPSSSATSSPSSSPGCSSPLSGMHPTPPAAFDVRAAAEKCRAIEGYVSFMDVTGLGCPAGIQDEDEDGQAETHRRWSWDRWFSPSSPPTAVVHKQLGKP